MAKGCFFLLTSLLVIPMYIFSGVTNNEKADPPSLPSLPPPPHPNNRYIWDVAPPPRPLEIAWDHHSTCPAARLTFVTLFSSFVSFSFVVFCPFLTRFFYLFRLLQRDALSRVPIHSLVNHSFFPFSSESTLPTPLLLVVFFFSFFSRALVWQKAAAAASLDRPVSATTAADLHRFFDEMAS